MNVGEDVRQPPVREVVDIRALRALAHPFRVKLYELVGREGTLTTTQASGLTGESPASCSYHLRQLAKYGFIEEAPRGSGRERPWRRTSAANDFRRLASDPGFAEAAALAAAIGAEQYLTQLRAFLSNPDDTSPEWRDRSFLHDSLLYLTLDELADLKRDVLGLMARYQQRTLDPAQRPATSRPIAILATGFPLPPTPAGN